MSGKAKAETRPWIIIVLVIAMIACGTTGTPVERSVPTEEHTARPTATPMSEQVIETETERVLVTSDDFSDPGSGWQDESPTEGKTYACYQREPSIYKMGFNQQTDRSRWTKSPAPATQKFSLAVAMRFNEDDVANSDSRTVAAGLMFGHHYNSTAEDYDYFAYIVSNKGYFHLLRRTGGRWETLVDSWQGTEGVLDLNEGNEIRADVLNGWITVFVNNVELATYPLPTDYEGGGTGLFALLDTEDDNPVSTEILFDNYVLHELGTSEPEPQQVEQQGQEIEVIEEEIVELSAEEMKALFIEDSRLKDLAYYAQEQGYGVRIECGSFPLSNGTQSNVCAVFKEESEEGDKILLFQAINERGQPMSVLVRFEPEAMVLYDRETEIRITEEGSEISRSPEQQLAMASSKVLGTPLNSAFAEGTCTTTWLDEYRECTSGGTYSGPVRDAAWCGIAVAGAVAACAASLVKWPAIVACVTVAIAALGQCGNTLECLVESADDPPEVQEIVVQASDKTCPPTCVKRGNRIGVSSGKASQVTISAKDDREPQPKDSVSTICPGEGVDTYIRGCSGPSTGVAVGQEDDGSWFAVVSTRRLSMSDALVSAEGETKFYPVEVRSAGGKWTKCEDGCQDGTCVEEKERTEETEEQHVLSECSRQLWGSFYSENSLEERHGFDIEMRLSENGWHYRESYKSFVGEEQNPMYEGPGSGPGRAGDGGGSREGNLLYGEGSLTGEDIETKRKTLFFGMIVDGTLWLDWCLEEYLDSNVNIEDWKKATKTGKPPTYNPCGHYYGASMVQCSLGEPKD